MKKFEFFNRLRIKKKKFFSFNTFSEFFDLLYQYEVSDDLDVKWKPNFEYPIKLHNRPGWNDEIVILDIWEKDKYSNSLVVSDIKNHTVFKHKQYHRTYDSKRKLFIFDDRYLVNKKCVECNRFLLTDHSLILMSPISLNLNPTHFKN